MPLRLAGPADQNRLERWLFRQDKLYAKFSLGGLGDWLEHGLCLMSEEEGLAHRVHAVRAGFCRFRIDHRAGCGQRRDLPQPFPRCWPPCSAS